MKRNIRLTIEYDGSRYQGWQRLGGDSNANTIQGKLESVLSKNDWRRCQYQWVWTY